MRYRQAQPGVQVTDLLANLKAVTCLEHFLASFAEYDKLAPGHLAITVSTYLGSTC